MRTTLDHAFCRAKPSLTASAVIARRPLAFGVNLATQWLATNGTRRCTINDSSAKMKTREAAPPHG